MASRFFWTLVHKWFAEGRYACQQLSSSSSDEVCLPKVASESYYSLSNSSEWFGYDEKHSYYNGATAVHTFWQNTRNHVKSKYCKCSNVSNLHVFVVPIPLSNPVFPQNVQPQSLELRFGAMYLLQNHVIVIWFNNSLSAFGARKLAFKHRMASISVVTTERTLSDCSYSGVE